MRLFGLNILTDKQLNSFVESQYPQIESYRKGVESYWKAWGKYRVAIEYLNIASMKLSEEFKKEYKEA